MIAWTSVADLLPGGGESFGDFRHSARVLMG